LIDRACQHYGYIGYSETRTVSARLVATEKNGNGRNSNRKLATGKIGNEKLIKGRKKGQHQIGFSRCPIFRCPFVPLPFFPLPLFHTLILCCPVFLPPYFCCRFFRLPSFPVAVFFENLYFTISFPFTVAVFASNRQYICIPIYTEVHELEFSSYAVNKR